MIEQSAITHHIQKHILGVLMFQEVARFRDLRPPKVDTNLFSYHLKLLIKNNIVKKLPSGYSLSINGLTYVDRVSVLSKELRTQPKIITMLVIQNSEGEVLLWKRRRQPYINAWTLPYGKLHTEDVSLEAAVQRELTEKIVLKDQAVRHVGDCYIHVNTDGQLLSNTLAHIFRFERDDIDLRDNFLWVKPHKLSQYKLAPAVEQIIARSFFNDPFFFEEFYEDWYSDEYES
ncbi:MAG: NUDIX domain-containing protein [Patescibacteria group bacterium]